MKNITKYLLLSVSCLCAMVTCVSCEDSFIPITEHSDLVYGTWVYDDPENGDWMKNEFLSSGTMYVSYIDNSINETFEGLNGKYTLAGNSVYGSYKLLSGLELNVNWTVQSINELEGMFIVNTAGGLKLPFKKCVGSIMLNSGDVTSPSYDSMLPDQIKYYENGVVSNSAKPQVKSFSSHNPRIAEVDPSTGEIRAMAGGRTYIEISTTNGSAVYEVNVKANPLMEFVNYLGKTRDDVIARFGELIDPNEELQCLYKFPDGDFRYMFFEFDSWTETVNKISLLINPESQYSNDDIVDFLNKSFYFYEKVSTNNLRVYINNEDYEKSTVGVEWMPNVELRELIFRTINHDLFKDYSPFLGKNRERMSQMMSNKSPFKDDANEVIYNVSDTQILRVTFTFNIDGTDSEVIQQVTTKLKPSVAVDDVVKFLNIKYVYVELESNDEYNVYLTADQMIKIKYIKNNNQVIYTNNF